MVKHEVKAHFGVLGTKKDRHGEPSEVRLCKVSWTDSKPMWDIRAWSADEKPLKGITLSDEMIRNLRDILNTLDL